MEGRLWKGAWGGIGSTDAVSAAEPPVPKLPEGEPALKASGEMAAAFLTRQVHAHPHAVTVIAAGPLTNLALAIRLDPTFMADAKALVFMGALIDTNMMANAGNAGNADYASDFNVLFDPEAAHIVLTAPMDVDISDSVDYGRVHAWTAKLAPQSMGLRPMTIVQAIDKSRFLDLFVKAAQTVGAP